MADLITRFTIVHEKGAVKGYFYSRESAETFFPPIDPAYNATGIEIGGTVNFEGKEWEVTGIKVTLFPERSGEDTGKGVGIYNVDPITPYDLAITVIVK